MCTHTTQNRIITQDTVTYKPTHQRGLEVCFFPVYPVYPDIRVICL